MLSIIYINEDDRRREYCSFKALRDCGKLSSPMPGQWKNRAVRQEGGEEFIHRVSHTFHIVFLRKCLDFA